MPLRRPDLTLPPSSHLMPPLPLDELINEEATGDADDDDECQLVVNIFVHLCP